MSDLSEFIEPKHCLRCHAPVSFDTAIDTGSGWVVRCAACGYNTKPFHKSLLDRPKPPTEAELKILAEQEARDAAEREKRRLANRVRGDAFLKGYRELVEKNEVEITADYDGTLYLMESDGRQIDHIQGF